MNWKNQIKNYIYKWYCLLIEEILSYSVSFPFNIYLKKENIWFLIIDNNYLIVVIFSYTDLNDNKTIKF